MRPVITTLISSNEKFLCRLCLWFPETKIDNTICFVYLLQNTNPIKNLLFFEVV